MSRHRWICELQDVNGKEIEYHSLDLEPEHYAGRADWNRAMTSWSAFRQRERKNLKSVRSPRSKVQFACHWMTPDDMTFLVHGLPKNMVHHKTIWDLYAAIGYDHKTKKYLRLALTDEVRQCSVGQFMARIPWNGYDPDVTEVLDFIAAKSMTWHIPNGYLRLDKGDTEDKYYVYAADGDGVHGSEWFTDVRLAIAAYVHRCNNDPKQRTFLGTRTVIRGE